MNRIFISHASVDVEVAVGLKAYLEKLGLSTWLARDDIEPGKNFAEEITNALEKSSALIVILSSASLSSAHVKREVNMSIDRGLTIIPVILGTPDEFISQLPEDWRYWLTVIQVLEFESVNTTAKKIYDVLANQNTQSLSTLRLHASQVTKSQEFIRHGLVVTLVISIFLLTFLVIQVSNNDQVEGIEILPKVTNIAAPMNDLLPDLPDAVKGYTKSNSIESKISINSKSWEIPRYWQRRELYDDCGVMFWVMKWEVLPASDGSINQVAASSIAFLSEDGSGGLPQKGTAGYIAAPGCMLGAFKLPRNVEQIVATNVEYKLEIWLRQRN